MRHDPPHLLDRLYRLQEEGKGMIDDVDFCPHCDVSMDLHSGPDSCRSAEATARLLELFGRLSA